MRSIAIVLILLATFGLTIAADERFMMNDLSVDVLDVEVDPPVSIKKTGDFLVLKVGIENDSREYSQRRQEIYDTLERMVDAATKSARIKLHSGEFSIEKNAYKIKLREGDKKTDTSSADVFVKIPLKPGDDVPQLTEELRKFISGIKVSGRTQFLPGEVGLSIIDPEQYRYELIDAIAKDVKKTGEIFGGTNNFAVRGLDKRLKVRRVSVTEVELYLAYEFEILPK
jgi:hypothetical protein